MRKFERITVDRGVAYIRDTGFSVSEIVSRVTDSGQLQNVLNDCPALKADDIQEALAYTVRDLTEAIAFWKNEGLTPLTSVEGYSKLLLERWNDPAITNDMKQQFIQSIQHNSWRAIAAWRHLREWARLTYEVPHHRWIPRSLTDIVSEVKRYLPECEPAASLNVVNPGNQHYVRSNDYLPAAIVNLIADRTLAGFLKFEALFAANQVQDDWITVRVVRKYEDGVTSSSLDLDYVPSWFRDPSPLSVAASIIRQHGSELQAHPSDEGITFEFRLPIWKEPQP